MIGADEVGYVDHAGLHVVGLETGRAVMHQASVYVTAADLAEAMSDQALGTMAAASLGAVLGIAALAGYQRIQRARRDAAYRRAQATPPIDAPYRGDVRDERY